MIFGDLVDHAVRGKTPKKTSPRKLVPSEDRIRARCVTGAHATASSTAVDPQYIFPEKYRRGRRVF